MFKLKKLLGSILRFFAYFIICFFILIPFLWMIAVSFRTKAGIYEPLNFIDTFTLDNYKLIFENNILRLFKNSAIVASISTLISLVLGTMAAYGFARFNWKNKEKRAFWILSQRFLPAMAVIIPYFLTAALLGMIDTLSLLVICYTTFNLPFTIWMMRGFIEDIPMSLEESALVDGCTKTEALRYIILPLIIPGMVATAIFCMINSWNEFVFANFLTTIRAKTIPTSVMSYLSVSGIKWGEMAATGTLAVLPVLLFAISVQKYMIRGLTMGSVKG
ncbi:MAG: carbohydrate ABC transporter permease [Christensenellaceae bacterium]|nr:carbohydrate ABC transporter permease [Christensenellaceae bacterium]